MSREDTSTLATRFEHKHREAIEKAAAKCGLPVGTWMRIILLAAAGISPLRDQLTKATRRAQAERGKS